MLAPILGLTFLFAGILALVALWHSASFGGNTLRIANEIPGAAETAREKK
jgi:hypothetical protein